MKPITEEQRKELIKFLGAVFESMNGNEPVNHNEFDIEGMTKMVLEIALESLAAEPAAEIRCMEDQNLVVENVADGFTLGRHGVYTAPPVPVIKFPNPHDIPDGYDLDSCMATVQWYQNEVKRLNGLGE